MQDWMIYGANGYTGELIAREAVARGLRPVLAGRDAAAVAVLAGQLGLAHRSFSVEAPALAGIGLVLNCAGPFSATAAPLMRACLEVRAHYLDITGEIDVFEHAQALSSAARAAGVVICPGVGFDVIPTDCLARVLVEALPDATHLALGFETAAAMSPGTAKTSVEGLGGIWSSFRPPTTMRLGRRIDRSLTAGSSHSTPTCRTRPPAQPATGKTHIFHIDSFAHIWPPPSLIAFGSALLKLSDNSML